jgi:hypothetical protein
MQVHAARQKSQMGPKPQSRVVHHELANSNERANGVPHSLVKLVEIICFANTRAMKRGGCRLQNGLWQSTLVTESFAITSFGHSRTPDRCP